MFAQEKGVRCIIICYEMFSITYAGYLEGTFKSAVEGDDSTMDETRDVNHGKALMIKAALVFPIVWILLSLFNDVSFLDSTIIAAGLWLISYAMGDLMVLPKMGNMAATAGDIVLGFLIIWGGLQLLGYDDIMGEALLTAAIITAGEYFYHSWLLRTQYDDAQV